MNPFTVEQLPLDEVPIDLRPREMSSVRFIRVREGNDLGLGQVSAVSGSGNWQRVIDSIPMIVITLGAFALVYYIVKELRR